MFFFYSSQNLSVVHQRIFWLMSENIHLWPIHSFDHSIKVFPGVYSTEVQGQAELPDTTPSPSGLSWSWLSLCPWKPVGGQVEEISLQRDSLTQDRVHLMTIYKGMAIWLPFCADTGDQESLLLLPRRCPTVPQPSVFSCPYWPKRYKLNCELL